MVGVLLLLTLPANGWFRDPGENETLVQDLRPMLKSVVALIFAFFVVPGVVYGVSTGSMKSDRDVIDGMAKAMSSMGLYMVLVFFAAQFVAFFNWTNLGTITAVVGADLLEKWNLTGPGGLPALHPDVLLRQPDAGQRVGPVGRDRADLRADADERRLQPAGHPGRLPHRRFDDEHHHADDELLRL